MGIFWEGGQGLFSFFWEIIPIISILCVPFTWGTLLLSRFLQKKRKEKLKNHEVSIGVSIFL
jgi:hypothetical protein